MNEIMRRFVKGLIMERNSVVGSISMAVMLAGKHTQEEQTPVAYLYNGVRLPKLPEWDRVKYPYAILIYHEGTLFGIKNGHWLYCSNSPFVWNADTSIGNSAPTDGYLRTAINGGATEWGAVGEMSGSSATTIRGTAVWANHDVCNEDGTTYLPASDPIPVYE